MKIIAHRGLRAEHPENTIPAIEAALCLPVHGVEFDCELPREGSLVVVHQETVEPDDAFQSLRLARRDYTARDWVIEHSAEEITRLDAGSWFRTASQASPPNVVPVPTLPEVLKLPWNEKVAYVELKDATFWHAPEKRDFDRPRRVVDAALPALQEFAGKVCVISFNPEILAELKKRDSSIPITLALWTEWQSRIPEAIDLAQQCGASAISLADLMILEAPEWVARGQEAGLEVHAYPVSPARDEPEYSNWTPASQEAKWRALREYGVDALLSDFARESLTFCT